MIIPWFEENTKADTWNVLNCVNHLSFLSGIFPLSFFIILVAEMDYWCKYICILFSLKHNFLVSFYKSSTITRSSWSWFSHTQPFLKGYFRGTATMKYRKSTTIWKYNCCTLFCSTIFVLLFGSTIFVLYFAVQFLYFEFVVQLLYYNLLYNFCTPVLEYSFYTTGRQYSICTIFTVNIFSPSFKYNYSTSFKFAYFHPFSFMYIALFVEYNK